VDEPSAFEAFKRFVGAARAVLGLTKDAIAAGFKPPENWGSCDERLNELKRDRKAAAKWLADTDQRLPADPWTTTRKILEACAEAKRAVERGGLPGTPYEAVAKNQILQARDALTELFEPLQECQEPSEEPATIWFHGEVSYSRDKLTPVCVSPEQHNLLKKFLDGDQAFTTKTLTGEGVSNVADVVNKLEETFGRAPIHRHKKKGHGYYLRVRTLPKTN
jgi:hypothetical protein